MTLINCRNLRLTVVTAAVLFLLGIALQAPRLLLPADALPVLTTLLSGTGLFTMLLSPILMIATALLALFPAAARQLNLCQH